MRNVLLIALSVFLAVTVGAYCISWYAQAAQIKNTVAQAMAKINEKQTYITYDALETSGFPANVYVSIVRPHFTGRVDLLLKSLADDAGMPLAPATRLRWQTLPELTQDSLFDGRITLGVNALSNHYSLSMSGNVQHKVTLQGQTFNLAGQSAGDAACHLQMQHHGIFGALWDFQWLGRNAETFFHDFRMLDCSGPSYSFINTDSKAKLFGSGEGRIYITSAPKDGSQQLRVYLKLSDLEFTGDGDAFLALVTQSLHPGSLAAKYAPFGKQNAEVDFSYAGPSDFKTMSKDAPLDVHLSKFDLTSQVSAVHGNFTLTNGTAGGKSSARLSYKLTAGFSDPYNALMQDALHRAIQQAYADNDPKLAATMPAMQKYTADQMFAIVAHAMPDFQSLGTLTQAVEASYSGNANMSEGDIGLTGFELSAAPYGITGQGSGKLTQGQAFPAGTLTLLCRNCLPMVDDMAAYDARLQLTVAYFDAEKSAALALDPKAVEGFKAFLNALAQKPAGDNSSFSYTLVSDGRSGVTVNGQTISQVMALYNEYVGSVLKKNAEAKAAPTIPKAAPPHR